MKKLLVYLSDYRKESILGPLFKLTEALLELLVPLVVAAVIDKGIACGDGGYVLRMCLLLAGLGLAGLACSVTAQYFAAKASVGFVKKLRHALFDHMQGFSFAQTDSLGTSTMITRMTSDMNQVQTGLNLTLRLLLRSPFVVFGAMVMAFIVDAGTAWIFVCAIPVLAVVVFSVMLACIPLYRKVQSRLDAVLGVTRENLAGVRVLRAFRKEAAEIGQFEAKNEDLTQMQRHVGRISAIMNPATYVLINLAVLLLLWRGGLRVEAGLLTQGAVVALYNYMSQILVELIKLANLIINITKSVACGNRIQAVLEQPAGETLAAGGETGSAENAVEFRNVFLRYPGAGDDSLSGISFTARRGQVIGVIGGTGSGKSSLVNMIPRFYEATGGAVLVNGRDVKTVPEKELRENIGVVPQKAVLFKGSIRENLRWGKADATDEELQEAVRLAQAEDVLAKKEGGLDAMLEQNGRNLSGGQRQRLTIARALVRRPEILILDDSSSALDFATDAALRKALRTLPETTTVFLVSQRTSSLQHADQILVLEDGRLAGCGKHEQLLRECSVYREIFDSQFKKEAQA